MTHTRLLFGVLLLAFQADVAVLAPRAALAQSLEIHELDADPDPPLGEKVTIDGRLQSAGGGRLRLIGSTIDVRYSESRIPVRAGTSHVQLTGELTREGDKLVLNAESLTPLPREENDFAQRRKQIAADNFAALYELSRWARARASWYDDDALRELASSTYRQAFAAEEKVLFQRGDLEGALQLAARGERLGLEPEEVQRLRYDALLLRACSPGRREPAHWEALAGEVRELLLGTDQAPPDAVDAPTADVLDVKSSQRAIDRYRATPLDDRKALHRQLWAALVVQAIGDRAQADAPDWHALAREVAARVPERADLARRFELAGFRRDAAGGSKLSREELVAVQAGLSRLEQPAEARSVVDRWLRGRRTALPPAEAEDRIQLAEDFLELADNKEAAAELYREALAIAPRFEAAESGLRRLGYEQIGGVWKRVDQADQPAAEETVFRPGMREEEVIRRLRKPDRISRTASSSAILEQWSFDGPPALVIYLRREPGGGASVIRAAVP